MNDTIHLLQQNLSAISALNLSIWRVIIVPYTRQTGAKVRFTNPVLIRTSKSWLIVYIPIGYTVYIYENDLDLSLKYEHLEICNKWLLAKSYIFSMALSLWNDFLLQVGLASPSWLFQCCSIFFTLFFLNLFHPCKIDLAC